VTAAPDYGTIRVLLADDDKRYAAALRLLIEEQPELTVVALAYDGVETLSLAEELEPDAVVVDLHMPNMDGVTAISKLRAAHPLVCLIALTGDEDPTIHTEATNAGADGVLVKGQMLEALVERLRNARERENLHRRDRHGGRDSASACREDGVGEGPTGETGRFPREASRASVCGEGRNRTGDTTVFSRVLYRLSYLAAADSLAMLIRRA
jgi:DNA-binding response OmpR family regulator